MKPHLLIVDDDPEVQAQMRWALAPHYSIATATDRPSALDAFRATKPLVVLLDLGLPPAPGAATEGLAALADLLALDPLLKIVIVSGQTEREAARHAIGSGAYDHIGKPVDLDELKLVLRRCFHVARLEREFREMRTRMQHDTFEGLLGTCPAMQAVFESIRKVATTDAPVLILGESGTGKEMTARAIHQRSLRAAGPFIAINCSAIPETLIESELFGHEKGAFTGAHTARKGRIELSHGGTLFLDEIGEVPLGVQVKLLRFLQEQSIERVGGRQSLHVDSRVLAATNIDLEKALASGKFREDLFYRIAVVRIVLPPLRERGEDVVLLASYFLLRFATGNSKPGLVFSSDALQAIRRHTWPGNVRELQNRIRRGVIMCDGKQLTAADLELTPVDPTITLEGGPLRAARERVEREMVRQALRRNAGNITAAAAELGISRPTLYELMEKLGVARLP
ncbi:MAG TPA: PEP-CTERM-box response regulator transcription factor [Opitutus sp.]|nr:PEP-CTERM-box response regulator transcription factor [Opitutus sp.]